MILFRRSAGPSVFNNRIMKNIQIFFGLWIFFSGCTLHEESDLSDYSTKIVVEGWIENDKPAMVILSQNKPLISTLDSAAIDDIIIRWAKVTVSDGENSEVLVGQVNKNYLPPFIYRGNKILGKTGKTYTLKIEYSGRIWTAQTTIPAPLPLESLQAEAVPGNDTLFTIQARLKDPQATKDYYKFFTRVLHQHTRYLPAVMGNLDDNLFPGQEKSLAVNKGFEQAQLKHFHPYYHTKDTVLIKFCTLPEDGFRFWTAYENELINGQNPFFPAHQNLFSNIENGLGIWCGYGCSHYRLIIP